MENNKTAADLLYLIMILKITLDCTVFIDLIIKENVVPEANGVLFILEDESLRM